MSEKTAILGHAPAAAAAAAVTASSVLEDDASSDCTLRRSLSISLSFFTISSLWQGEGGHAHSVSGMQKKPG